MKNPPKTTAKATETKIELNKDTIPTIRPNTPTIKIINQLLTLLTEKANNIRKIAEAKIQSANNRIKKFLPTWPLNRTSNPKIVERSPSNKYQTDILHVLRSLTYEIISLIPFNNKTIPINTTTIDKVVLGLKINHNPKLTIIIPTAKKK